MEDSYNLNLIRSNFVKHREGKTPDDRASECSVDNGLKLGITNDAQ